jgi:molecular chaperone DnaJ
VSIAVPQKLDQAAREAVESYAAATVGDDPREGLMAQARQA